MQTSPPVVDVLPFELLAEDGVRIGATLQRPRQQGHWVVIIHGATAVPQALAQHDGEVRPGARHGQRVRNGEGEKLGEMGHAA